MYMDRVSPQVPDKYLTLGLEILERIYLTSRSQHEQPIHIRLDILLRTQDPLFII